MGRVGSSWRELALLFREEARPSDHVALGLVIGESRAGWKLR